VTFRLSTWDYVSGYRRRYGTRDWLLAGPDYSRAVEYPLVARMLKAEAGQTLLDVGAGRRAEFSRHAAEAGLVTTAADLRDDLGADVPAGVERLTFWQGDARGLPFADGSFDRIAAISTLEHIEDGEDRAVAELARVLAPGGRLVVSVPFNPLRSGKVHKAAGVYGRTGERVFFEHLYDEDALQRRIVEPSGLVVRERVQLKERGLRLSRWYYEPQGAIGRRLRFRTPVGAPMALAAPFTLRPVPDGVAAYDGDEWIGSPVVLALEAA
jgi:SAM-dependent methyltransferase